MGFSEAVQWWEEWHLRILVLTSLFLQYFLFVGALLRKSRIPSWFRSLIWLAYHCCDVVVIYALATLFNQNKKEPAMHGCAHLGTLWASILLLHLGGQDGFAAYSIEDNEKWRRQLLIAVSQITVAIYVFCKSWWSESGDDRKLLRAAILLLVPGVLKCLQKPWALKKATMSSIMNTPDSRMEATLKKDTTLLKDINSLDRYLEVAANTVKDWEKKPVEVVQDADEPYHLFADLGHPYVIRLKNLQLMLARGATGRNEVHALLRSCLSKAFDRLYTKSHKQATSVLLLRAAIVLLQFVGVGLFQRSRRQSTYDHTDVVVTYVLLCSTAALELISAVSGGRLPSLDDQVSQYNLIGHLARNKKHERLRHLADRLGCKALQLDRLWCMELPKPTLGITKLVYDHVVNSWWKDCEPRREIFYDWQKNWWSRYHTAAGAYRRFNDSRGQRALAANAMVGEGMVALWSSLRMPFDESVLLWHLATEFCYFEHVDTGSDAIVNTRVLSNYMAYLLFTKPEMLMPGARRSLVTAACHELQTSDYKVELEPKEVDKEEMARNIIRTAKRTVDIGGGSDGLVHRAWALADELMEFAKKKAGEEEEEKMGESEKMEGEQKKKLASEAKTAGDDMMWKVIQGVWVEMLCFAAGRCRGCLHAKSLGNGGEYLSYVWLLLSYTGMETMPERTQRPDFPVEGDTGALVVVEPQQEETAYELASKTDTKNPERVESKTDTKNPERVVDPDQTGTKNPEPAAPGTAAASLTVQETTATEVLLARPTTSTPATSVTPILGDDDNV